MNLETIRELKELKKEKNKIKDRESELTRPLLSDLSLINTIYTWFWEIMDERDRPPKRESILQRKKFLFIILYLYFPKYFLGIKMPKGLRVYLSNIVGYENPTMISHMCHDIVDQYMIYKDIRKDVSDMSQRIVIHLKECGYI